MADQRVTYRLVTEKEDGSTSVIEGEADRFIFAADGEGEREKAVVLATEDAARAAMLVAILLGALRSLSPAAAEAVVDVHQEGVPVRFEEVRHG